MKFFFFYIAAVIMFASCEKPDPSLKEMRKELNEDLAIEKTELRDEIVDAQRKIDIEIDNLREKGSNPSKRLALKRQKESLDDKLDLLNEATVKNWDRVKADIEKYLSNYK